MISRRSFFQKAVQGVGLSAFIPALQACAGNKPFGGVITGPNAALGHRLRTMDFPKITKTTSFDIVIIGGGVSGLSAARFLKKHTDNFLLLELEDSVGGNSIGGRNSISAFPWGAHYLPLPGNNDPELITFLRECNVITGFQQGRPLFNEYFLCHDPKERLFINHYWQDSIIPHEGVPKADREQIERFLSLLQTYKQMRCDDDRYAFSIPLAHSSQDSKIVAFDKISADQFLTQHKFDSPYLRWYVNYCCADDYGSSLQQTSAWAMMHYFASRRSDAANASADAVLTWPEGNSWLIAQICDNLTAHIRPGSLAYNVIIKGNKVEVDVFDSRTNISEKIIADQVIMATPQFINRHLLNSVQRDLDYGKFQYAPWVVANITLDAALTEHRGEPLCWDNVIYGSDSLGYVNASHQQLGFQNKEKVITYYKPLIHDDAVTSRMNAYARTHANWSSEIVRDLASAHRNIARQIRELNIWIWGHGMIRPSPGFIWSTDRLNAGSSICNRIHFAHSDVSGISIFEEAFYNGHQSAKKALGV